MFFVHTPLFRPPSEMNINVPYRHLLFPCPHDWLSYYSREGTWYGLMTSKRMLTTSSSQASYLSRPLCVPILLQGLLGQSTCFPKPLTAMRSRHRSSRLFWSSVSLHVQNANMVLIQSYTPSFFVRLLIAERKKHA